MESLFFYHFPEFLIHGMVFAGFAGLIISFFVETIYTAAARLLCLSLLMLGIYMEGILSFREHHNKQVKEYEVKVELAERKAEEAKGKTEIVYQDRVKVVKQVQVVVQEKIRDIAVQIDDKCEITPESVNLLNAMARSNPSFLNSLPPITIVSEPVRSLTEEENQ